MSRPNLIRKFVILIQKDLIRLTAKDVWKLLKRISAANGPTIDAYNLRKINAIHLVVSFQMSTRMFALA